jgi:predicted RND superfamily exporter protein
MNTIFGKDYSQQRDDLHKNFLAQLDITMESYPAYKTNQSDTYSRNLSILNGITKSIQECQSNVNAKNQLMERQIKVEGENIATIKTMDKNLKNVNTVQDLDATSKQMLQDSVEEYNQARLLFWIKLAAILIIVADTLVYRRLGRGIVWAILSLLISFFYFMYKYFRS